jgi:hypothetical protein
MLRPLYRLQKEGTEKSPETISQHTLQRSRFETNTSHRSTTGKGQVVPDHN